jgi:predicted transcriptional regulator/transcriptional regulator with XRE-family HTH domain
MARVEPRLGGRIQRLRRSKSLSQAQLARALGISPSYLNLIEHNRRHITVELLLTLARYFQVDATELAEADRSQLAGHLMEVFGDDCFTDLELTNHDIQDLATSNAKIGHAVVRLFDSYSSARRALSPGVEHTGNGRGSIEWVSDFLQAHSNYFPALEAAADRVRSDMDLAADAPESGLKSYLYNTFGIRWRVEAAPMDTSQIFDADRNEIVTSDMLPPETAVFVAARRLGYLAAEANIEELLVDAALPPESAIIARDALAGYFAAALLMPYPAFFNACKDMRYDVDRIARRFKVSFEQVCHRMTTLQRPGLKGVPLHLIRTDIAGNISKRFSISGIYIPRHSGACPRWNVYSAFLHPQEINIQISQMPEGDRYLCIAKSLTKGGYRHNAPRRHLSIGLGCHISQASALIYADGIDTDNPEKIVPIGVGCRSCPRLNCEQRAHPMVQLALS